jgi:hypothetical protein
VKTLLPNIREVFCAVDIIVNKILGGAINYRMLKVLREDAGGEFTSLLFHSEVPWLPHEKILSRMFQIKGKKISMFFKRKRSAKEQELFGKMDHAVIINYHTLQIFY